MFNIYVLYKQKSILSSYTSKYLYFLFMNLRIFHANPLLLESAWLQYVVILYEYMNSTLFICLFVFSIFS